MKASRELSGPLHAESQVADLSPPSNDLINFDATRNDLGVSFLTEIFYKHINYPSLPDCLPTTIQTIEGLVPNSNVDSYPNLADESPRRDSVSGQNPQLNGLNFAFLDSPRVIPTSNQPLFEAFDALEGLNALQPDSSEMLWCSQDIEPIEPVSGLDLSTLDDGGDFRQSDGETTHSGTSTSFNPALRIETASARLAARKSFRRRKALIDAPSIRPLRQLQPKGGMGIESPSREHEGGNNFRTRHQNVRKRRRFQKIKDREETGLTRKLKACIRCRAQRIRVRAPTLLSIFHPT